MADMQPAVVRNSATWRNRAYSFPVKCNDLRVDLQRVTRCPRFTRSSPTPTGTKRKGPRPTVPQRQKSASSQDLRHHIPRGRQDLRQASCRPTGRANEPAQTRARPRSGHPVRSHRSQRADSDALIGYTTGGTPPGRLSTSPAFQGGVGSSVARSRAAREDVKPHHTCAPPALVMSPVRGPAELAGDVHGRSAAITQTRACSQWTADGHHRLRMDDEARIPAANRIPASAIGHTRRGRDQYASASNRFRTISDAYPQHGRSPAQQSSVPLAPGVRPGGR